MTTSILGGINQETTQLAIKDKLNAELKVRPNSLKTILQDQFQSTTIDATKWSFVTGASDLMILDGNVGGASFLAISKSPWNSDTESYIESSILNYAVLPVEIDLGLSASQRAVGQEFSIELIDTDAQDEDIADMSISAIQQSTTTLTITTVNPHNLVVGKCIGIRGVSDNRLNYPAVVVNSIISSNQFTVTTSVTAALPSLTVGPFSNGYVYFRPRMSRAKNGVSQIFENTTVTNSSYYVRTNSGDALMSGTIGGSHASTCATLTATQLAAQNYVVSFLPAAQFKLRCQEDFIQFTDIPIDSSSQTTSRYKRTQVVPDSSKNYKLRLKAKNQKTFSRPIGKIVSIVKSSASTTATVTLDRPHGLLLSGGSYQAQIFGVRDQTNFANLTAATTILSVPSENTITIAIGTAAINTSFGGYLSLVEGQNLLVGSIPQVIQSAAYVGSTRRLTLVANTTWTGLLIGDLVDVNGTYLSAGGSLIDNGSAEGGWRVLSISTTTMILEAIDGQWNFANSYTTTNCGGAVIKRSNFRIHFARVFDIDRVRVENQNPIASDFTSANNVIVNNTVATTLSSTTLTAGTAVIGAVSNAIPLLVADVVSAALTTTTTVAAITPSYGSSYEVNIPVTAVSGTNPVLDFSIEESDDAGTNWYKVYDFPRISSVGIYRSPKIALKGNRIRYVQTVSGTTPSFTRAVNRLQLSDVVNEIRQIIDRTVVLNTLNSVTPSLNVQNCSNVQIQLSQLAGAVVQPAIQLEGSDDNGLTWYAIGTPLTGVVSATVSNTIINVNSQLVRGRISTAGTSAVINYVLIKGFN